MHKILSHYKLNWIFFSNKLLLHKFNLHQINKTITSFRKKIERSNCLCVVPSDMLFHIFILKIDKNKSNYEVYFANNSIRTRSEGKKAKGFPFIQFIHTNAIATSIPCNFIKNKRNASFPFLKLNWQFQMASERDTRFSLNEKCHYFTLTSTESNILSFLSIYFVSLENRYVFMICYDEWWKCIIFWNCFYVC